MCSIFPTTLTVPTDLTQNAQPRRRNKPHQSGAPCCSFESPGQVIIFHSTVVHSKPPPKGPTLLPDAPDFCRFAQHPALMPTPARRAREITLRPRDSPMPELAVVNIPSPTQLECLPVLCRPRWRPQEQGGCEAGRAGLNWLGYLGSGLRCSYCTTFLLLHAGTM